MSEPTPSPKPIQSDEESFPSVDSSRIDGFYSLLESMHVSLDFDPLEFGPKRLNGKIAECRGILSKCEKVFLEVSHDLHWYKRRHRLAAASKDLRFQDLLANDPDVRHEKNITDREAVANTKLRSEQEHIDRLHFAVEDLEAVLAVVKTKRADLKDIQGRLKDQLKVCQEEISLGARWGSALRATPRPKQTHTSGDEVDNFMDEILNRQSREISSETEDVDVIALGSDSHSELVPNNPPGNSLSIGKDSDENVDSVLMGIPSGNDSTDTKKSSLGEEVDSFLDLFPNPRV